MDENFEDALKISNKKHDVVALRIFDSIEIELPKIGIIPTIDAETGVVIWVNTANSEVRKSYKIKAIEHKAVLDELMAKCGVDCAHINTKEGYVRPLVSLFKKRERKR